MVRKHAKIALVNPPPPQGAFIHYQNPPIGLAYLAAILEANDFDVKVIDCPPLNINYENLKREIKSFQPNAVGITSVTVTSTSAFKVARIVKETFPETLTILGGPHVTVLDEQILMDHPEVDIVVRGEGEQTMLELANLIANSNFKVLDSVAGITFRRSGRIIRTPDRPFIQNLDQLPRPAYKYFPLEKYKIFGKLILPILASRGCPYRCAFCLAPKMAGKKVRARSPKSIVDELEWLRDACRADAISFHDETFTYYEARVLKICEEIKKRKIDLPWDCSTRVDCVSKKLLATMKSANCQLVSFGVESGSQKILEMMRKGTTVEQNEKAIKIAKEVGLSVTISIIIGYPGETEETLKQTLDFIRRTEPDDVHISIATPYPGTELYDLVKNLGWRMVKEWHCFDMQTPVFDNPNLPIDLKEERRKFYSEFYSPKYVLLQSFKGFRGNLYCRIMARAALNNIILRNKLFKRIGKRGHSKA
ncbi:MAG: radical SAM protein [Candidatus Bathyarchaeia archaeon]